MSKIKETAIIKNNVFTQLVDLDITSMIAEELDGLDAGFERIKIPSAGSTVFEVPGEKPNEPDAVKEFSGVILHHHTLHAYYKDKYTGGNSPPDCGSLDGIAGEGDPGGNCAVCPLNRFGSGENGSKACKNRRRIYVLREGEIFPLLLSLPTGSLKEFTRYIKRLLSKGRRTNSVITQFSLKKATNSGGIAYSQAQFAVDRLLTDEEYAVASRLSEQIKEYSHRVGFEFDDSVEDDSPLLDSETEEIVKPLKGENHGV